MNTLQTFTADSWQQHYPNEQQSQAIQSLEQGQLLYLPQLTFPLSDTERGFLTQDITTAKAKNISYDPHRQLLKGTQLCGDQLAPLIQLMQRYHTHAYQLITQLLPHYQSQLTFGRTSLRTVEVAGRKTSYKKDDSRLHVDAFPSSPTQGKRILRVFSNINPHGKPRVWHTGEPFQQVATKFLPQIKPMRFGSRQLLKKLKITKGYRSAYDHYMLKIHDKMKHDTHYQQHVDKTRLELAAGASWIVYTDLTSHAAISGQHLLEQTFYLPPTAMYDQKTSPLAILTKLTGKKLI